MSSAVAELDAGLQAMLGLKPPGISGTKVNNLTALCFANVQSESVLIQKIYTHFKKAPPTHKLGVLYIVDSVTRKWLEQAKVEGQAVTSAAQDGTYAAAVHRVTELMPVLMNDILATAPEDQKDKIKKLVDIWEKGMTFPPAMVASFKAKLSAAPTSTTPPGSPPPNSVAPLSRPSAPPAVASNIMAALANIARQNTTAAQSNPSVAAPMPAFTTPAPFSSGTIPLPTAPLPNLPFQPVPQPPAQPVSVPQLPFAFPPQMQPGQVPLPGALNGISTPQPNVFLGQPPPPAVNAAPALDAKVQQQLALIQTLAAQGVPIDKITSIIALMGNDAAAIPSVPPQQMPQPTQSSYAGPPVGSWQPPRQDESRDRNGYHDSARSPDRQRGRSRSRSPRRWDSRDSPRGRGNDRGHHGHDSPPGRGRDDRDRGHDRGADYRQRSPNGRRGQSPHENEISQEKWIEHDPSLPHGHIKVMSRTLFVGGVTCSENELRQIFSRFGQVQTCIVNKDKRHAFVKMYLRKDAVSAKEGMDDYRNQDLQLRTRWGVGFGPRDCSDYSTGISVIPIHKLTEADRKWMLTAPYGGTGGRPIVSGMCVEEPDIEIGAGVSSKAISRRMQTDKGGNHGPKSSKQNDDMPGGQGVNSIAVGGGRWRNRGRGGGEREENRRDNHGGGKSGGNEEPVVLGFPPGITMGPNGINFPPGFAFPAPQ